MPFLIIYADKEEYPECKGDKAEAFCEALLGKSSPARTYQGVGRTHATIVSPATTGGDPVVRQMLRFIAAPRPTSTGWR